MASQAERLAELVTVGEAGLAAGLPRQLTHGDFCDGNVFFRGEAVVFAADFGFLAERARIDDLALTLYYADTGFGLTGRDRIAALRPLVRGYTVGLGSPLTPAGHQALPWAIARQPLWGIGGWVVVLDDQRAARAHARATFPAIGRAWTWAPASPPGRPSCIEERPPARCVPAARRDLSPGTRPCGS